MVGTGWDAIQPTCCNCKFCTRSNKCLRKKVTLNKSEQPKECPLFQEKEWGLPISQRIEFSAL